MARSKFLFFLTILYLFSFSLFADSLTRMQEAAKENKHLFIFFYKDQNDKMLRLQDVFDRSLTLIREPVKSMKVNIKDPSEKAIVDQFSLKRTPMPFVIVLAPNGAITGGFSSFTEEQLVNSISSEGAAHCLKALQDRKLVLLCLQNNQTAYNEAALKGAMEFKADSRFGNATEMIVIDPLDVREQKFLNQLSINANPTQAMTLLISPPSAKIIGTYQGPISKTQIISDLQNATSGSCCGCCPGGCCPGGKCR